MVSTMVFLSPVLKQRHSLHAQYNTQPSKQYHVISSVLFCFHQSNLPNNYSSVCLINDCPLPLSLSLKNFVIFPKHQKK